MKERFIALAENRSYHRSNMTLTFPTRKNIAADSSTVQCHLAHNHSHVYHKWCKQNDVSLNAKSRYWPVQECIKPSDAWCTHCSSCQIDSDPLYIRQFSVSCNQMDDMYRSGMHAVTQQLAPGSCFQSLCVPEHTTFHDMIQMALHGPRDGINIPSHKATWIGILDLFCKFMNDIKTNLTVSLTHITRIQLLTVMKAAKGHISLTSDAWTAGNGNRYFVVISHWIEEAATMKWELKMAIITFIHVMKSHSGNWMGQALFKVCKHVGIEKKVSSAITLRLLWFCSQVGHITGDNASNNARVFLPAFLNRS